MNKLLLASVVACGLVLTASDLQSANAQYGYRGGAYCPGRGAVAYRPPVYAVPAYRASYYGGNYGRQQPYGYSSAYRGLGYGSGLTVTRSSLYAPAIHPYGVAPVGGYGLGGYGNLGYPRAYVPGSRGGVSLRIGF